MKVKIEDKTNCQKLIKIEVESEKVKVALSEVYKLMTKDANVRGFRKGKVPVNVLQAHYSEEAKEETIRRLIWDAYREVIDKRGVKPLSYPVIEDVKLNDNEPLYFTIKVDVAPVINLKPYKNIKIKKPSEEVTESEVNSALESVREQAAQFEPVQRPAEIGDHVVCDYDCVLDGKTIDSRKNGWLSIEKNSKLSPMPEQLVGCAKGQVKEVELTLPKDYKQSEHAGKKSIYKITVNEVKKKIVPALDDELAKRIGNYETIAQLKEKIKEELTLRKKQTQRTNMEDDIFTNLLKANQFDVPESSVQRQLQGLVDDAKMRLMYQGYKKEEVESQDAKLKEQFVDSAKRQVMIFFMLEEIAKNENISVTDEEFNKRVEEIAKSSGQQLEKFRKTIEERELAETIKQQLLHDKAIEFLIENASIIQN
ncbi:MAG: trigger factor [Candidatus Omnitrophota bacterium]